MERIAVDGLTVAAVLARIAGGVPVVLTQGGDDVAVVVRPDDLSDAATAYLLEAFERSGPSLSALLADLEAAPRPITPNGRPQSPPEGVSRIDATSPSRRNGRGGTDTKGYAR